MRDVLVFNKIFNNLKKVWMSPISLLQLRTDLRNYDLPETVLPVYMYKYHAAYNLNAFNKWLKIYFYGLMEYNRIVSNGYSKLFMQPLICSYLYANFINYKEHKLVTKRAYIISTR